MLQLLKAGQVFSMRHSSVTSHFLIISQIFMKHGRRGKPKPKVVCLSQAGTSICWIEHGKKNASQSTVELSDALHIARGKTTSVLKRTVAKSFDADVCLSVVLKDRTVDLAAQTKQIRDEWAEALEYVLDKMQA